MKGVDLLTFAIKRDLEHFIASARGICNFDELDHAIDRVCLTLVLEPLDLGYRTGTIGSTDHAAFLEKADFFWRDPGDQVGDFADHDHYRAALLLLSWTEGFKASLDGAPALAKFQSDTPNLGWLWRYYLRRKKDLI